MLSTWGKVVKNLRIHSWIAVDDYPQIQYIVSFRHNQAVYNHSRILIFPTVFTRTFPHRFLHKISLLRHLFSPLSTPPITISTNL